mgnify:CR=1 FL=1
MMAATSGRIKEDKRVLDKTLTEFQLATSTELDFVARLHAQNVQKHAGVSPHEMLHVRLVWLMIDAGAF